MKIGVEMTKQRMQTLFLMVCCPGGDLTEDAMERLRVEVEDCALVVATGLGADEIVRLRGSADEAPSDDVGCDPGTPDAADRALRYLTDEERARWLGVMDSVLARADAEFDKWSEPPSDDDWRGLYDAIRAVVADLRPPNR
jgi:hypothetical protein